MPQTVKAWTRQDKRIMDDIERLGRYTVKRKYIREKNMEIADYYSGPIRLVYPQGAKHS